MPSASPITVRGVTYPSKTRAAIALCVNRATVHRAIRSDRIEALALRARKPVTIRGVTYASFTAASEALGVNCHTISNAFARGALDMVGFGSGTKNVKPGVGIDAWALNAQPGDEMTYARDTGDGVERDITFRSAALLASRGVVRLFQRREPDRSISYIARRSA